MQRPMAMNLVKDTAVAVGVVLRNCSVEIRKGKSQISAQLGSDEPKSKSCVRTEERWKQIGVRGAFMIRL